MVITEFRRRGPFRNYRHGDRDCARLVASLPTERSDQQLLDSAVVSTPRAAAMGFDKLLG